MSINAGSSVFTNQPVPAFQVDEGSLANGQILVFDTVAQAFVNTTNSNTTTVQSTPGVTGSNIFIDAVDGVLTFKTIKQGTGITITDSGTALTISADPNNQMSAVNLGTGAGVFESINGFELRFKSIKAHPSSKHLTVTGTSNEVQIQTLAEINTGTNVGTEIGKVFRGKTNETLEFKSIGVDGDLALVNDANDIIISPNYTLSSNQLVVGDTSTHIKTFANGPVGSVLKTGASGLEWSSTQASSFQFRVTFEADGGVDVADQLPAGWSTNITGNLITVTHTVGRPLRNITYWGFDSVSQNYRWRAPTGTHQVTIPVANQNTKFAINVISQVAGAEVNGHAIVSVQF
jgi:hypothetical protein